MLNPEEPRHNRLAAKSGDSPEANASFSPLLESIENQKEADLVLKQPPLFIKAVHNGAT